MSEARQKAKHRGKKNAVREMPEEDPDFQIAPMIDVLLVLLVFFMSISSTEVLQSTKGIELPIAAAGSEAKKNVSQATINISWLGSNDTGGITMDEKEYKNPSDLIDPINAKLKVNKELRVLIRADKQTRYDFMRAVMVAVGQTAVPNVTFSVVDKEAAKVAAQ